MRLLDFLARHYGAYVQSAGGLGGECVDLANQYLADVFALPHVYKDAVDWQHEGGPHWRWVENTPSNAPPMGALVVWEESAAAGTGPNGHIALVVAAGPMHLVTADQNWPTGAPVRLVLHSYAGVIGWLVHIT